MFKCELCGKEFETLKGLAFHIGQKYKNKITIEEYYFKFIGEKGKCIECGKDTRFLSLKEGYRRFCSCKCSNNSIEVKEKQKISCFKNSGYEHPLKNPVTKQKQQETNFRKTGYLHALQNPKSIEKQKETTLRNNNGIHHCKLTYQKLKKDIHY